MNRTIRISHIDVERNGGLLMGNSRLVNDDLCNIDFDALQRVDVRTIDPDTLVDISDLIIDTSLPKEERIKEFVRQVKNPYCFRVGKVAVSVGFSKDNVTFEQRMEHYLQTL